MISSLVLRLIAPAIKISYAGGYICNRSFLLWTNTRQVSACVTLGCRIFDFRLWDSQIEGGSISENRTQKVKLSSDVTLGHVNPYLILTVYFAKMHFNSILHFLLWPN
jgi:hypothetical protein